MGQPHPPRGKTTRYYRFEDEYRSDALNMAAAGWRVTTVGRMLDTTIMATYTYNPIIPPVPAVAQMGDFEALAHRPYVLSVADEFEESYLVEATMGDVAALCVYITDCAIEGANFAQSLDTSLRATARANDNAGIKKVAPQAIVPLLANYDPIPWLHDDFTRALGEYAFEQGFVKWCDDVLDCPEPPQHSP